MKISILALVLLVVFGSITTLSATILTKNSGQNNASDKSVSSWQKLLQTHHVEVDLHDPTSLRLLSEYGAMFVAQGDLIVPPYVIFPNAQAVDQWQAKLKTETATIAGIKVELQVPALHALQEAQKTAEAKGLKITPHGTNAARRSYAETARLWQSRVEPGLKFHVQKGHISAAQAQEIRQLSPRDQIPRILALEAQGYYFSQSLDKSILYSVAAVGSSQHISLLALDVLQHDNAQVRAILAQHGWFQTVVSDAFHFTYLGATEEQLPSLGLKKVMNAGRPYWLPNMEGH